MMNRIMRVLNNYTMYYVLLVGLGIAAFYAVILSFFGALSFSALALLVSFFTLGLTCYASNTLLARVFGAFPSKESSFITAWILFFLLEPSLSFGGILTLVVAGFLAMASKYVFAYRHRHVFNPVAISAVLLAVFGSGAVVWWVANPWMLPVILLLSLALTMKLRRWHMVGSFVLASTLSITFFTRLHGGSLTDLFPAFFVSWPVVFFAGVMLTEPATAPSRAREQTAYGILVGLLFGATYHVGTLYSTPELALVIGNLFAFVTKPHAARHLTLVSSETIANGMKEFLFRPNRPLLFRAGQYAEWTLASTKHDARGNRRYFTLASGPSEDLLRLAVRIPETNPSTFKQALTAMQPGDTLALAQLAGDFVLPEDTSKKLVWIAGGIGVTPFRSQAAELLAKNETRDVTLLYSAAKADAFAYLDLFEEAEKVGVKTVQILGGGKPEEIPAGWKGKVGYLTPEIVRELIPDAETHLFYLSGPSAMVDSYKTLLRKMGIPLTQIHTDYFPGF